MNHVRLDPQRYFESIDTDTERLLAVAARGLQAGVPCCPGWTVAEVVRHVAMVYEHKVRVMADNAWPDDWPPPEPADAQPLDQLAAAKAHLFAEFAEHQLTEETTTFDPADGTIGFWARRMALEVAVHRYDAELAHDDESPIPDDVALDGIDEVLRVMLGGPWWTHQVSTRHPLDATVAMASGGRRWLCTAEARRVTVVEDASSPAASTIDGEPMAAFLWLWGRVGDAHVSITGDQAVAAQFRARIGECTG